MCGICGGDVVVKLWSNEAPSCDDCRSAMADQPLDMRAKNWPVVTKYGRVIYQWGVN